MSDDTMLEHLAAVLYDNLMRGVGGPSWAKANQRPDLEEDVASIRAATRAMVEAMREPTKVVLEAGTHADWVGEHESREGQSIGPDQEECWDENGDVYYRNRPGIWAAMIDAILNEGKHDET